MKNEYEIRNDITSIKIMCRGVMLETIINTSDLAKVMEHPYQWFGNWSEDTKSYYAYANTGYTNGKRSKIAMHRWIVDVDKNKVIDHINHDTLNNTRINLRVVTKAENSQNLMNLKANNTSGYRGVHKNGKKWRATVRLNGKVVHIGYFDNEHIAGKEAAAARARLLANSLEAHRKEVV